MYWYSTTIDWPPAFVYVEIKAENLAKAIEIIEALAQGREYTNICLQGKDEIEEP